MKTKLVRRKKDAPVQSSIAATVRVRAYPNEGNQAAEVSVMIEDVTLLKFRATRTDFHCNVRSVTLYRELLGAMPWFGEVEAMEKGRRPATVSAAPRGSQHAASLQRLAAQERRAHAGDDDDEGLLDEADEAWPDSDFVASVREQYEEGRAITDAQRRALTNIINRRGGQ